MPDGGLVVVDPEERGLGPGVRKRPPVVAEESPRGVSPGEGLKEVRGEPRAAVGSSPSYLDEQGAAGMELGQGVGRVNLVLDADRVFSDVLRHLKRVKREVVKASTPKTPRGIKMST